MYGTPPQIAKILRKVGNKMTLWKDFERVSTKIEHEQYICVVKGAERFRLVSPIFRKNIYVGAYPEHKDQSPLDFFAHSHKKYPHASNVNFLDITLKSGDCVYVPAYYYIQSKTITDDDSESLLWTQEYEPHSKMLDLVFNGLETHKVVDDHE